MRRLRRALSGAALAAALVAAPVALGGEAEAKKPGGPSQNAKGPQRQAVAGGPASAAPGKGVGGGEGKQAKASRKGARAPTGKAAVAPVPPPAAVPAPVPAATAPVAAGPPAPAPRSQRRRRSSPGTARAAPRGRRVTRRGPAPAAADAGSPASLARRPAPIPRPQARRPAPAQQDAGVVRPVTRTVRELVEVVPGPVKALLGALALAALLLGGGYALSSARARRLARQRADLLQEVGLLQTALLPPVPATVGAVRTSVAYRPSDGPGAGGDFYDALTLPGGRAAFILGDVSGHGRQALGRTAFMRYTLRAYLEAGLEPRMALQVAGTVIDEHLGGDFATVVLAVHDPADGSLTYACAGHPAPIVVGPSRPEPILTGSAPPVGLGLRTGLRQTTLPLTPGSVACLYTDGLAEARTDRGVLGRPRVGDLLAALGRDATAAGLLDRVSEEAARVTDDMATVVLTPTAGITSGGFRREQLELDADEAREGLGAEFLTACGVSPEGVSFAEAETAAVTRTHGAAVLHVRFGIRGPHVEVRPPNAEGLEAASRRAVARAR
jgi:hypothetical protein